MTLEGANTPDPEEEETQETEAEETDFAEPEEETEAEIEPETETKTEPAAVTETALVPSAAEVKPAAEPAKEPEPKKPSNEIKVVIVMKDTNILTGVQSPDCDPIYDTMTGTMADALQRVPALIEKAKQKWAANPRNPKADLPAPPPPPTPAPSPARSKSSSKSTKEQPTAEVKPKFF